MGSAATSTKCSRYCAVSNMDSTVTRIGGDDALRPALYAFDAASEAFGRGERQFHDGLILHVGERF